MFNADLALSVTMTAISTLVSVVALPLNLLLYAKYTYNDDDIVESLDWGKLIFAIFVVICAIGVGLWASAYAASQDFRVTANKIGNVAGVLLIIFSAVMSTATEKEARLWNREPLFYLAVALPCICGLLLANAVTSVMSLWRPERVTISIECCYQNIGIATSVALSMFNGANRSKAIAVPFMYGVYEGLILFCYCIVVWKLGWTKAPRDVGFFRMLFTSYEVLSSEDDVAYQPPTKDVDGETQEASNDYYMVDYKDVESLEVKEISLPEKTLN